MSKRIRHTGRFGLIAAVAIVLALACAVPAAAAPADKAAPSVNRTHQDSIGTLKTLKPPQDDGEKYMENAALVMFRTSKQMTKGTVKSTLCSGSDAIKGIEIADVWSFDEQPEAVSNGTGKKGLAGLSAGKGRAAGTYGTVVLVKSKKLTTKQIIKKMRARDDVLYAEPNYKVHALSVNDPYFSSQWSMQGGASGSAEYSDKTPNVTAQWDEGTTGTQRIVAVVDTGVDYSHPDLQNNMWHNSHYPDLKGEYGFDFSNGDDDPMDDNGHGSHCAGIIGAQGNNGQGISGVNQSVRIMALKTLDADGSAFLSNEIPAYHYINKALDLGEPVQAINNSWGGGEESDIFAELIDILGEKGAVSVFAAGNEWSDNDEVYSYPANVDSAYRISVAASTPEGNLAGFSNYGKSSVDVAAPGTDILSTVPYVVYNPTIYGADQASLSAEFNDYETEGDAWGSLERLSSSMYLNGEPYDAETGKPQISMSRVNDGFIAGEAGHSILIDAKKMKGDDLVCLTIPYEIDESSSAGPFWSVAAKAESSVDEGGMIAVTDVPQGAELDLSAMQDLPLQAGLYTFKDDFDNWAHFSFQTMDDFDLEEIRKDAAKASGDESELDPMKRQIVIIMYAQSSCDIKLCLDDMGLSRQDVTDTEAFGRYDFMSGTSMAAPFITGSAALIAEARNLPMGGADGEELVAEVVSRAKAGDLPVASKGLFDFTLRPAQLPPRIGSMEVNQEDGTITINGIGLNPAGGLTVSIGPSDELMKDARILSQTDRQIVVKDEQWINNVETVRVTAADGRTSARIDRYLVDGKKEYTEVKNAMDETNGSALTTDGRYIYFADASAGAFRKLDTKKLTKGAEDMALVDPEKIFKGETVKNATYSLGFGDDLVYMNGKVYTVVEYGQAAQKETDDEFWFFFGKDGRRIAAEDESDYSGTELGGDDYAIYSGDSRLISVDVKTGKVTNLGKLPTDLKKSQDYTVAAYNGKLYFMGGYSYADHALTNKVTVFDPAKKKNKRWSAGKAMPQERAGGMAMQSGKYLYYTMGYNEAMGEKTSDDVEGYRAPSNLIFNGKSWKTSSMEETKNVESLYTENTVTRGGKTYPLADATISPSKKGLIYMGMPVADYGDTFIYNASADAYQDTGYNYIRNLNSIEITGIAVKGQIYGFTGESIYTAKAADSGFFTVKVKKNKGGKVSGQTVVPPGNNAVFKVKAKKGYVIKSVKAGSKKIKVKKNARKMTVTVKKVLKNQTLKVTFRKK